MTIVSRKEKLHRSREFLTRPGVALGVGAGDALGAKLIEKAGFDFIWSSSLCVSACYAVPDANLISMSQYCDAARSMNEVVSIPVIASSGAGCEAHFAEVFENTDAEAALAAGIFHRKEVPIRSVKQYLSDKNIPIRAII